jgi:hypothetical protein
MKKKVTKQVRISLQAWEQVRRVSFKTHKPMSLIIEQLIIRSK